MRGNETTLDRRTSASAMLSIPMRGNEFKATEDIDQAMKVIDPHEG